MAGGAGLPRQLQGISLCGVVLLHSVVEGARPVPDQFQDIVLLHSEQDASSLYVTGIFVQSIMLVFIG